MTDETTETSLADPDEILNLIINSSDELWKRGTNKFLESTFTISRGGTQLFNFPELNVHSFADKMKYCLSIHFQPSPKLFLIEWSTTPKIDEKVPRPDRNFVNAAREVEHYNSSGAVMVTQESDPALWQSLHEKMLNISKLPLRKATALQLILQS